MHMKRYFLLGILLLTASTIDARPKIIAHRGYWRTPGSAQNSLAAFAKADSIGVYGSEMDVWLTADDRLVVNHDRTYQDVDMETSKGRAATALVLPNGEQLPTLDAYLKLAAARPATRLVLELKSLSDPRREDLAARKIVRKLRRYGLVDRTDVIAFSLNACLAFHKLLPNTKIFYLEGDLAPHSVARLGLTGIDYPMGALRAHPEWVQQAHDRELEVNVWTVDDPQDMEYFIRLGVDYITTNEPVLLQQIIGSK